MGISMHAMDLANGVDYAVGSVTNSGFEKIVEINPQHKDYVILGVSGYNGAYNNGDAEIDARNAEYGNRPDGTPYVNPQNVCPARIYVGLKGKMEDGKSSLILLLLEYGCRVIVEEVQRVTHTHCFYSSMAPTNDRI